MKQWITSDTHFEHKNIIKLCDRPFPDIESMNNAAIEEINSKVHREDILYHLGDFAWNEYEYLVAQFRFRIRCKNIILVSGNHDKHALIAQEKFNVFNSTHQILDIITNNGQHITMCHYPMLEWNKSHRGSIQFFGHKHTKGNPFTGRSNSMEIGFEPHGQFVLSLDEAIEKAKNYWAKSQATN